MGELLESVLNQVLELQMIEHLGAERHQRSSEREGYRNGYRARQLYTRVGRLNQLCVELDARLKAWRAHPLSAKKYPFL